MINSKKLADIARRWRKAAAVGKRTLPFMDGSLSSLADRGHFVVYTSDGRRFELPLEYLNTGIFRELLRLSEDEYGLPGDGPITLACDASFMEYVSRLLSRRASKEVESAVIVSIAAGRCTEQFFMAARPGAPLQQLMVHGF